MAETNLEVWDFSFDKNMSKFKGICTACGTQEEYRIIKKANNQCCYCHHCNKFIGNKPYDDPKLYFGKYKGKPLKDFETPEEISYLNWIYKTEIFDKLSTAARDIIEEKI